MRQRQRGVLREHVRRLDERAPVRLLRDSSIVITILFLSLLSRPFPHVGHDVGLEVVV